jgi:hypothetical protein
MSLLKTHGKIQMNRDLMKKDLIILWLQKFSTACKNNHKYGLEYCCEEKIYSSQRLKFEMLRDTRTHSR